KVGSEQALGDERGLEAAGLRLLHHVDGELERGVDAGNAGRLQLGDGGVHHRLRPDGVRQRCPHAESHHFTCAASGVMSGSMKRLTSSAPSKSPMSCIALMRLLTLLASTRPL